MGFLKSFGPLELFLVLLIVLVIFGAGRLPEIGKGLGSSIRGFKDAMTGKDDNKKDSVKTAISASTTAPVQPEETKKSA
ncbi:MAG: twin-arginine translocase TatA/TatE family subunit [Dehalococcoidia bacterium]|nr:twin-arginine translocase TatA/TatE family subunit [Dehalococcoidia bacterium]MSQ35174.1 twin-arginine translocase TatA/TatE family subunit [Dehalococcoidia bacterium]